MYSQISTSEEFLVEKLNIESQGIEHVRRQRQRPRSAWNMIHICLFCINIFTLLFFYLKLNDTNRHGPGLIHSPAHNAQTYEKVLFDDDLTKLNPYRGPPRPELDEAWANLVRYSNIRVSADELKAIDRTSVQLSDGSGMYMAELNVHHQLHCLKVIRQSFHPEYYNLPQRHMSEHMDHCLDNLRLLIMCKADISLQTYDWLDNNRPPFANFKIEHECFNWDSINDWAKAHSFDLYDNKTLAHPTLGVSFPVDENGSLIMGEDADPLDGKIITQPII